MPDGAIVVAWGKRSWRALLEVKTGTAELAEEQVSRHVDLAKHHDFDAVVTLSNQITASAKESPVKVHGGQVKRVDLAVTVPEQDSAPLGWRHAGTVEQSPIRLRKGRT